MIADIFFEMRLITNENSKINYLSCFEKYSEFHGMTLKELLEEAEREEDEGVPLKRRTLKNRLISFQSFLSNNYSSNTTKGYMSKIKTFYKTFEIQLPYLPQVKTITKVSTTYEEILTKDEIKQALESTNNIKFKALILFMLSSGTAINEATKLTVQDFIQATKEYHNKTNIEDVLQELSTQKDVIPTFYIVRQKKEIPYYTFCSPEATNYIVHSLQIRLFKENILLTDKLFGYTPHGAVIMFINLNDRCGFPRKQNGYRRFHSHGLRKYFASTLANAGMSKLDVDFLEGRKADRVTSAYYIVKPEQRLRKYKRFVKYLTIFDEVNYIDITSQEKQHYDQLKKEIHENKRENSKIKQMLFDLKKLL